MNNVLQSKPSLHAGVDEAGRGSLVGSVFAAAVILSDDFDLPGLNDSKKISEKKRNILAPMICDQSISWAVASASVAEIHQYNILQATLLAMKRAVAGLQPTPVKIWIDGNVIPQGLSVDAESVIQGDSCVACIAAASILAKVARDKEMYALAKKYPQYGFDKHKGYGTAAHLVALQTYGVLPEHRQDFAPVKRLLAVSKQFDP